MKVRELLDRKDLEKYRDSWKSFKDSHTVRSGPLSEYEVHSGMPVIGEVFQFQDKPFFKDEIRYFP